LIAAARREVNKGIDEDECGSKQVWSAQLEVVGTGGVGEGELIIGGSSNDTKIIRPDLCERSVGDPVGDGVAEQNGISHSVGHEDTVVVSIDVRQANRESGTERRVVKVIRQCVAVSLGTTVCVYQVQVVVSSQVSWDGTGSDGIVRSDPFRSHITPSRQSEAIEEESITVEETHCIPELERGNRVSAISGQIISGVVVQEGGGPHEVSNDKFPCRVIPISSVRIEPGNDGIVARVRPSSESTEGSGCGGGSRKHLKASRGVTYIVAHLTDDPLLGMGARDGVKLVGTTAGKIVGRMELWNTIVVHVKQKQVVFVSAISVTTG